jgi:hypothetical protein
LQALAGALLAHLLDIAPQLRNARPHDAAVDFQLRLAGSPGADGAADPTRRAARAAAQAREMLAVADEARQAVLVLRQLDLELALARAGVLGEDIQDKRGAVDDLAVDGLFEVALLRGGELVVDDDQRRAQVVAFLGNLRGAAFAEIGDGVGLGEALETSQGLSLSGVSTATR